MLSGIVHIFREFEKAGFEDPLKEFLSLMDLLSGGTLRHVAEAFPSKTGVSLGELIEKRLNGVPLEYILGFVPFMGMCFPCSPAALIPRTETELLARTAINIVRGMKVENPPILIVDMGTGSGNIALSIASYTDNTHVLAIDVSCDAVELARSNVERYGLHQRVSLYSGDLFKPLSGGDYQGRVDMVVCNPPYIPTASIAKELIAHEPVEAFNAGAYGLDFFRRIISESPHFMKPGGVLIFEIGVGQDKLVARLLQQSRKYRDFNQFADQSGRIRVISAISQ